MSKVTTYLVIVHQLEGDMIRATEYFGEEDVRRELADVRFHMPPVRKEIHSVHLLVKPLTKEQLLRLEYLKQIGICTSFYVKDEISHE